MINSTGTADIPSGPYAGLRMRIQAFIVDYLVIAGYLACLTVLGRALKLAFPGFVEGLFGNAASSQVTIIVVLTIPVILYFAILESSLSQASLGKRWKNLMVIGPSGKRLSREGALYRALLKFIPWELAHTCIWQIRFASQEPSPIVISGFVLVWILVGANIVSLLLDPANQTLYDRLAGSSVVVR